MSRSDIIAKEKSLINIELTDITTNITFQERAIENLKSSNLPATFKKQRIEQAQQKLDVLLLRQEELHKQLDGLLDPKSEYYSEMQKKVTQLETELLTAKENAYKLKCEKHSKYIEQRKELKNKRKEEHAARVEAQNKAKAEREKRMEESRKKREERKQYGSRGGRGKNRKSNVGGESTIPQDSGFKRKGTNIFKR